MCIFIGRDQHTILAYNCEYTFRYPSVYNKTLVFGVQKNRLIEMVLLSTHNCYNNLAQK